LPQLWYFLRHGFGRLGAAAQLAGEPLVAAS
jgi:hypothetical protein